ncbi:MAG: PTS sugar transporter subunit IIA [Enterococcus sp.]
MTNYAEMIKEHLIDLSVDVRSIEELFTEVSQRLLQEHFVNEGYLSGVLKREEEFPTGLMTQYVSIALPHADPEYIACPFIYIARVKTPLLVKQMGDNQPMRVRYFLFLGIQEPAKQVGLLQVLLNLFMNEQFVEQFCKEKEAARLYQLMKAAI